MKLSIVIPMHNAERFIEETLNSILQQKVEGVEILCIDDGSTDNSAEIVNEIAKAHNNLHYYYQENAGAPMARNKGYINAKGEYLYFFDADDIVEKGAIQGMLDVALSTNADIVVGNYEVMSEDGSYIDKQTVPTVAVKDKWELIGYAPNPGSKIFKKQFLEKNNLKFASLKIGQDLNFYLKCMAVAEGVGVYNGITMKYRLVEGGISRTYTRRILGIIECFNDVKDYYYQHGLKKEYRDYIECEQLHHLNVQVEKIKLFDDTKEAKNVRRLLASEEKKIRILKGKNKFKKFKRKVKFYLITLGLYK